MTVVRHLTDLPSDGPIYVADRLALRDVLASGRQGIVIEEGSMGDGVLYLPHDAFREARETVERLLDPDGCPWDRAQTHASLRAALIEECFEAVDAIDRADGDNLREELGDLFLHIALHAALEARGGGWRLEDVARELNAKLIRRHPHVFGDASASDAEAVIAQWNRIKASEKSERVSELDGVPKGLPALQRALDMSRKAARVGFEWPDLEAVWLKVEEEIRELRAEIPGADSARMEAELGDLLFSVVNIARWLKIDPEQALRTMVLRFEDRFRAMERAAPKPLKDLSPEEWDMAWNAAKSRPAPGP